MKRWIAVFGLAVIVACDPGASYESARKAKPDANLSAKAESLKAAAEARVRAERALKTPADPCKETKFQKVGLMGDGDWHVQYRPGEGWVPLSILGPAGRELEWNLDRRYPGFPKYVEKDFSEVSPGECR